MKSCDTCSFYMRDEPREYMHISWDEPAKRVTKLCNTCTRTGHGVVITKEVYELIKIIGCNYHIHDGIIDLGDY